MRRFLLDAFRRLVLLALAAILMSLGSGLIAWDLGNLSMPVPQWIVDLDPMIAGGVCVGVGLLLVPLALIRDQASTGWHLVQLDPLTTVALSSRSLRAAIAYEGTGVPGVTGVDAKLRITEQGWRIRCSVNVDATRQYAETIQGTLTARIRHSVEALTGLPVDRLTLNLSYVLPQTAGRVR